MNRTSQLGFTLVELSVVVLIMGMLAFIAIPVYKNYLGRAQSSAPLTLMDGLKGRVVTYFQTEGGCPDNTTAEVQGYGIAKSADYAGQYIESILVDGSATSAGGCIMTAKFRSSGLNGALIGKKIYMQLFDADKGISKWTCYTDIAPQDYSLLISSCGHADHPSALAADFGP